MATKKDNPRPERRYNIICADLDVAKLLDLNCGAVYHMLRFWIETNETKSQNYHDGRYWTYNSVREWCELIPYLTEKQIWGALDRLEKAGLIVTGNYNKLPYDRTKWYSINPTPQSKAHFTAKENAFYDKGEPIPVINTIINTEIKRLKDTPATKKSTVTGKTAYGANTKLEPDNSSSKDTPATKVAGGNGHKEMVSALEATTGMDMKIKTNAGRIVKVAKELRDAGYSFQNVNQFGELWKSDWRYKQNKTPPTLAIIKAEIGRTKNSATPKENQTEKFRKLYKEQG